MRGDAENRSINIDTIDRLFNVISDIGSITFGGGEMSVNEHVFLNVSEYLLSYGIDIASYFIVLNGAKKLTKKLLNRLKLLKNHNNNDNNDGMGGITFSFDSFHTECMTWEQVQNRDNNLQLIDGTKHSTKNNYNRTGYGSGVINMGRGTFGTNKLTPYTAEIYDNAISNIHLYLNVYGDLFSDCNLSYEEMDKRNSSKWYIGNVSNISNGNDLITMVKQYNKSLDRKLEYA